jgi:diguanylate cyclase (GGDEF)-like protein
MAKPDGRPQRQAAQHRAPVAERRARAAQEAQGEPARRPAGAASTVMRLSAEVDALRSELAAARAKVAELEVRADVDPLLDILNRRGFERELKRSLAYVRRYGTLAALVYLDLDGFKAVNDRHGHAAGDALLRTIASALVRCVRASDVVGRLGGDELAVLLWNVTAATAAGKAQTLEQAIATAEVIGPVGMIRVGASAGVAMLGPLDEPGEVLDRADRAMYARKAERRRFMQ